MKKKLLSLIAVATLSTTAFADIDTQIGGSINSIDSGSNKGGIYLGYDLLKHEDNGLMFGAGFNINAFKIESTQTSGGTTSTSSGAVYTMAIDALLGYSLKDKYDIPLAFKAGLGYGVTHDGITKDNYWGMQYNASATYTIYKEYGLGVRYNVADTQLSNIDVKIKSAALFLNIAY